MSGMTSTDLHRVLAQVEMVASPRTQCLTLTVPHSASLSQCLTVPHNRRLVTSSMIRAVLVVTYPITWHTQPITPPMQVDICDVLQQCGRLEWYDQ